MGERLIAQGEQATILGAQILPTAQAELTGSRSKRNLVGFIPGSSTSFTSNSFTSGLNISWELDLWGKLADARDSAEKSFRAGEMELQGAQISLAGQVAKAWYEVIEGSQQVILAQKSAESFARTKILWRKISKGLPMPGQKLAQTGTAHAQAKTLTLGTLDASKRRLNILLGKYPSVSLDQNLSVPSNYFHLRYIQSSPGTLLANRPDLLAAEQKAQASGLDLSVARKNFFPSIS